MPFTGTLQAILTPGHLGIFCEKFRVVLALAAIGAVVLERLSKGSEKRFLLSQILASASLVIGMFNAFM